MTVKARKRFFTDLKKIKSLRLLDEAEFIFDFAKTCRNPDEIPGFKYLTGFKNMGRIRVDEYRIGVEIQGETIIFHCIIHRSVVYK